MTHDKKTSSIVSGIAMILMVVSTSVWAEGYSQTQNKVDDKDADRLSQPRESSDKKNDESSRRKSSADHHGASTDNRSGNNPNVPPAADKKGSY